MRFAAFSLSIVPLFLLGCAAGPLASPVAQAGVSMHGNIHGGQQPVIGASVYLYAAGNAGYAGNGIPASSANASLSLLTSSVLVNNPLHSGVDANNNYYVTTDASGSFTITGDYSCVAGQQVYVYATGGNPGSGTNANAGFLAVLGNCPGGTSAFLTKTPFISMNEVSTVAAAYAMAGYATDATHISSGGSTLAATGIANAFAASANLAALATGSALATTPAGNGTVPQAELNTLANILAACVNSAGANSSGCSTLNTYARSAGSSGTVPADTASAAINIAHNPGANIAALYALPTAAAPFAPTLSAQPNDFTVALAFTGGGLEEPSQLAIDAAGNVWAVNDSTLSELNPVGAPISGTGGYPVNSPLNLAIDTGGYVWVTNFYNPGSLSKLTSLGTPVTGSPYTGGGLYYPYGVAIDPNGDAWVVNDFGTHVSRFSATTGQPATAAGYPDSDSSPSLTYVAIDTAGNVWGSAGSDRNLPSITRLSNTGAASPGSPYAVASGTGPLAIDASGSIWIAGETSGKTSKLTAAGVEVTGSPFTGGGQCTVCSNGIAIDGAGNVWITDGPFENEPGDQIAVAELNNAGGAIAPATGYQTSLLNYPRGLAIDGAGNVWVSDEGSANHVIEFVGAAAPVVTPIAAGTKNNTLGTRP